jgi:hypothetical protein
LVVRDWFFGYGLDGGQGGHVEGRGVFLRRPGGGGRLGLGGGVAEGTEGGFAHDVLDPAFDHADGPVFGIGWEDFGDGG